MCREFRSIMPAILTLCVIIACLAIYSNAQNLPAENTSESFYEQARKKVSQQDYEGAIQEITKAISLDRHNPKYFYYRGYCYAGRDNAKALADYDQALNLKPDYKDALFGRVFINRRSNKQKALADLKKINAIDPADTLAYGIEAQTYLETGLYDEALAAGSKLAQLYPAGSAGYRYQGDAVFHKGRFEEAISYYSEAIKRDEYDADALRGRSEAYRRLGNNAAADADQAKWENLTRSEGIGTGSGGGMGTGVGKNLPELTNPSGVPDEPADYEKKPAAPVDIEPLKILTRHGASYTEEARQNGIQGTVVLRVTFLASGKIGSLSVIKALPFGLTEKAEEAARGITFIPAKKNGAPVTQTKVVTYTFSLF